MLCKGLKPEVKEVKEHLKSPIPRSSVKIGTLINA